MKCVYYWSTILLIAFLVGIFSGKDVIALRRNEKASKFQESIALSKVKRSRRSHDENTNSRPQEMTNLGNVSAKTKMFPVIFNATEENLIDLNYETLWQNGSETLTRIAISDLADFSKTNGSHRDHVVTENSAISDEPELLSSSQSSSDDSFLSRIGPPLRCRLKRLIFGRDGRIKLNTSTQAQKFPFSASVKISTGCTGSLISHLHVLTSAHCVHDGQRLVTDVAKLKVGFLRRNGKLRWTGVDNVKFPQSWRLKPNSPIFDYAVITLRRAHKRPVIKLGVIEDSRPLYKSYKLHFASFPGDKKSNALWYSHCKSKVWTSDVLIGRCDASTGSSGAGTYVRTQLVESGKDRVLVGILSGSGRVPFPDGHTKLFNFVTRLTNSNARQICRWIGVGSDCISWRSTVLSRLRSAPQG